MERLMTTSSHCSLSGKQINCNAERRDLRWLILLAGSVGRERKSAEFGLGATIERHQGNNWSVVLGFNSLLLLLRSSTMTVMSQTITVSAKLAEFFFHTRGEAFVHFWKFVKQTGRKCYREVIVLRDRVFSERLNSFLSEGKDGFSKNKIQPRGLRTESALHRVLWLSLCVLWYLFLDPWRLCAEYLLHILIFLKVPSSFCKDIRQGAWPGTAWETTWPKNALKILTEGVLESYWSTNGEIEHECAELAEEPERSQVGSVRGGEVSHGKRRVMRGYIWVRTGLLPPPRLVCMRERSWLENRVG